MPGGCDFTGVRKIAAGGLDQLRATIASVGAWIDRDLAEQDRTHKQVIPYVVVRDGARVFLMERTEAGRDPRLHRRATIGVGGHLNPVDSGSDPLDAGLRREWAEELAADWEPAFTPVGLLNDDRNAVGSVHLGVVFTVDAAARPLEVRERHKLSGRMATVDEIHDAWDRMETWSHLVAAALWGTPPG